MAYQVKNQRQQDGTYRLSYGRGSRKLVATLYQGPDGQWWLVPGVPTSEPFGTMKAAKEAWGQWAARSYSGQQVPTPPAEGDDPAFETTADRQALIDTAPTAVAAEHRYQIFTAMERMVEHEHDLAGEAYQPHAYRRRIPRRKAKHGNPK